MGTITRKGQITIPKEIRTYLGLAALDQVEFLIREGEVVLKPVRTSLLDYRGFLKGRKPAVAPDEIRQQVKRKVARRVAGASAARPRR